MPRRNYKRCRDPEAAETAHGSQETIASEFFLNEIDEHLKYCLTGADQERNRMILWLYFRQGMSTKQSLDRKETDKILQSGLDYLNSRAGS